MDLYHHLKAKFVDPHHVERRKIIIDEMNDLGAQGYSCQNCIGHCCTYQFNSMQVTPLQALDAYVFLRENNLLTEEVLGDIDKAIRDYRLDVEISIGKLGELRKNYTCPFYHPGSKGCGVSRKYKPYGCLGFNALEKNVSDPGQCSSNIELLEAREELFDESKMNEDIKETLKIYWDKKNFPVALRVMIEKMNKS